MFLLICFAVYAIIKDIYMRSHFFNLVEML